jgi:hypothetical protein
MVVDRAVAFDRERRYPDARAMLEDLRAVAIGSEPPTAALLHVDDRATLTDEREHPVEARATSSGVITLTSSNEVPVYFSSDAGAEPITTDRDPPRPPVEAVASSKPQPTAGPPVEITMRSPVSKDEREP